MEIIMNIVGGNLEDVKPSTVWSSWNIFDTVEDDSAENLTEAEVRSYFVMTCILGLPIPQIRDITEFTADTVELIMNPELMELHAVPIETCAVYLKSVGDAVDVWFKKTKDSEDGCGALAFFNGGDYDEMVTFALADICTSGKAVLRDAVDRFDLGEVDEITLMVPSHDTVVFTLVTDAGFQPCTGVSNE